MFNHLFFLLDDCAIIPRQYHGSKYVLASTFYNMCCIFCIVLTIIVYFYIPFYCIPFQITLDIEFFIINFYFMLITAKKLTFFLKYWFIELDTLTCHGVGISGLVVTYGLNLNILIGWTIWNLCNVETKIISVERIQQYTRIQSEAPLVIEENRPPQSWPSEGTIELQHLQVC